MSHPLASSHRERYAANPTSPWILEPVFTKNYQKTLTRSGDTWVWDVVEEVSSDAAGIFNACITGTMRVILSR